MKRLLEWVRRQHRERGPIVGMIAALVLLSLLTLIMVLLMGLVGLLMWFDPYTALIVAAAGTAYLIYKRY